MLTVSVLALVLAAPWLPDDDNTRPSLGIFAGVMDDALSQELIGISKPGVKAGVVVTYIEKDGPAYRKLQVSDIITSFNGKPVKAVEDLTAQMKAAGVGKECRIAGRRKSPAGRWIPFDEKIRVSTALATATEAMREERDEVRRLTITKHYGDAGPVSSTGIMVYLSTKGDGTVAFLRVQYRGEKWAQITKCHFRIDDDVFTLKAADVKRDTDGGKVWEYVDFVITKDVEDMLRKQSSAQTAIVRLEGDGGAVDHSPTDDELERLDAVLVVAKSKGFVAK